VSPAGAPGTSPAKRERRAALLEVEGLRAGYGPVRALHGVDVEVAEGGVVAVLGPNGAGKTTILRALTGMVRASGRITFAGRRLLGLPTERIVRLGVAHVPEGRGTFPALTVDENLRLGAYLRRDSAAVRADLDRWYTVFPRLADRRGQAAGSLSGGEQQMLSIARALLLRPRLLLLDEPSLGLAPKVVRELFEVLGRVKREQRTTMLLVEQNANLALELADQAYVLEAGRTVLAGPAAEVRTDEQVRRAYLGY
jgi:branched-chain amino acid transport system ATP-binding protein